ncbi:unnamed protein product [Alopecurus aequalis]
MAKLAHSSFALDLLRRLLCAHSARADIAQPRGDDGVAAAARLLREKMIMEEGASPARSPCIVARLMGLHAMPLPAVQPTQLRRSRSASSAEGLSPPPPTPCGSPRPRVARTTSASFTDRPTYLRRENDEFLLLSFSPDDDAGDADEAVIVGKKQRREHRRRRHGEPGRSRRQTEECGSQNSSPVSVLDAQEESSTTTTTSSSSVEEVEQAEHCSPSPDRGEIPSAPSQQQGSRRKLLLAPCDDLRGSLPREAATTSRVSNCSSKERRDRRAVNTSTEVIAPAATGMWRIICRLVEEDICGVKWGGRDDCNVAAAVESEILDQLICDELMQLTVV